MRIKKLLKFVYSQIQKDCQFSKQQLNMCLMQPVDLDTKILKNLT